MIKVKAVSKFSWLTFAESIVTYNLIMAMQITGAFVLLVITFSKSQSKYIINTASKSKGIHKSG